ncbi:MAG TPA: TlpA disulfide reductase family protein [Acidimicrobiales bacterium]|nr:TlpA disulfide reductase family protein [Acidimicrobiales bacterium]
MRWVAAAVGVVMAVLVGVLATRQSAVDTAAASPLVGRPAPDIDTVALDGSPVRLADMRGNWVLVNFFNSWCVPCREEHPELLKFHARHAQAGDAVILGVIRDDTADAVRRWRAEEGGDWPAVEDPRGTIALDYGVRGQPETFVVSPDGVVVARYISVITADGIDRLMRRAA